MKHTITVRLSSVLHDWLIKESQTIGVPVGRLVREQIELAKLRKDRQPFLDLAGRVEGEKGLSRKRGFQK